MSTTEYRPVVTRLGRLSDTVTMDEVCDADRATKARDQWAGGALRASVRVALVKVVHP